MQYLCISHRPVRQSIIIRVNISHDLLVISGYVKSLACVNRHLHYHGQAEITAEMLQTLYP